MWTSTVLGLLSLDAAKRQSRQALEESRACGDNFILSWCYWLIAWDLLYRGLTTEAEDWAWKLIAFGRERQDRRALGMAHMLLAWIYIASLRLDDAAKHSDECVQVAVTEFDELAGEAPRAIAAILAGRVEEGLTQALKLRKRAAERKWLYLGNGFVGGVAIGYALSGQINKGVRLLTETIPAIDAYGDHFQMGWNRAFLAEIFLEILTSQTKPPLRVVLRNLGAILWVTLFGAGRALELLQQANRNEQLHEQGSIRARINMDLGLLYKFKKQPALARQYLEKAREAAELQRVSFMVSKIDAAIAELG
jgi:tetratricopeptide (TPR) repeat protein